MQNHNPLTFAHSKRVITAQRSGRVVDRGGLENRCTVRYRGFESLLLCIKIAWLSPGYFFLSCRGYPASRRKVTFSPILLPPEFQTTMLLYFPLVQGRNLCYSSLDASKFHPFFAFKKCESVRHESTLPYPASHSRQ